MFDIAASELVIIAVVALIVIGPERLPRVARTMGHLFGRMQRYVNDVKADIQREVELDELRKLKQTVEESARSIENSVNQEFNAAREEVRDLKSRVQAQEIPAADGSSPGASGVAPAHELPLPAADESAPAAVEVSAAIAPQISPPSALPVRTPPADSKAD